MLRTDDSGATSPAFMSHAPRPSTLLPVTLPLNGSAPAQASRSPGGTTSTCALSMSDGPFPRPATRPTTPHASARSTSTPGKSRSANVSSSWISQVSTSRSMLTMRSDRRCWMNLIVQARHARHSNKPREIGDDLCRMLVDIVEQPGQPGVMAWKGGGNQLSHHLSDGDGAPLSEQIERIPAVMSPHLDVKIAIRATTTVLV